MCEQKDNVGVEITQQMRDSRDNFLAECPENISFAQMKQRLKLLMDGDKADTGLIRRTLEAYKTDPKDWEKYANWNEDKYTRNLICDGNGKYNLMMLCWNLGQASSIHDHAGSHCFMKILDGELQEELYTCPDKVVEDSELKPRQVAALDTDGVAYISDKVGMHRISNESHSIQAVSLHLYSPPYQTCKSYCEQDGKSRCSGKITFYSVDGVKCCEADNSNPLGDCDQIVRQPNHKRARTDQQQVTLPMCGSTPTPEPGATN